MVGAAAADWAMTGDDDLLAIDVRMTLETDDGALVFARCDGLLHGRAPPSGHRPDGPMAGPVRSAMRFETADPRYAWMAGTVFIGVGTWDGSHVHYEVFEIAP
jgi:hypothetical protein